MTTTIIKYDDDGTAWIPLDALIETLNSLRTLDPYTPDGRDDLDRLNAKVAAYESMADAD